jgi:succinate dehydrogenase / fumarate reductase membrane anchor subunit
MAMEDPKQTPIARVRGLGSARSGGHHWRLERMISVATLLLFIWFIVSLLRLPALGRDNVVEWLSSPLAAVPMLLLIVTTFWHLKMGMQVIVEDYVQDEGNNFLTLLIVNFLTIGAAATALFAVLKIALGGGAG